MSLGKQQKQRRKRLFDADPHCYWCGRELVMPPGPPGGGCPDNAATLDHLIHRLDPRRNEPQPEGAPPRTVLACYACNSLRGNAEHELRKAVITLQKRQVSDDSQECV